ncbi:uncharacterized protein LOC131067816 [Cryptomeria japonica]|uniref:uncharacterized protein LOC131067816 n=1 Tax=Cryptomeria japonica TaxID=3369 RepID=UPI0027DA9F25|nr:uncharacterized protein LOC131067816 [Cryptomeria japonica]
MSSISNRFTHLRNLEEGFIKLVPRIKPNKNKCKGNLDNWRSGGNYAKPKVSVEGGKNPKTLPPPKPTTIKPNKMLNNSEERNVLEINDSLVERVQQSCKTFGVFARWCGLGVSTEVIADWLKSSFNWIVSIAILSEGFLYIDCGNARHKNEFLTGKSPIFKGFDFKFLEWQPAFNPNKLKSFKIDRPVLIPNLPVELKDMEIIRKIGNHLGKFVEISDKNRKYSNCVLIINMDISVNSLSPIEIKTRESSFLIYPEFYKGILDLDLPFEPVLEVFSSQINPRAIPKLDICFNLEKGGFVIKDNPPSTGQYDGVEEGEIIGDQSMDEGKNPSPLLSHEDILKDKQGRVSDSKEVKNYCALEVTVREEFKNLS